MTPGGRPDVSVIIPCHDGADWLRHAVLSALDQPGVDVEVVVVDDASSDLSVASVADLSERVVVVRQGRRQGANAARNRGVDLCSGRYVQFLDADDVLLPGKLSTQVSHLERTGADIAYGDWCFLFHVGGEARIGPPQRPGQPEDILEAWIVGWWYAPCAALFTRDAVLRVGPWDESLPAAQDRAYMLAAAVAGCRFEYVAGEVGAIYRRHDSGSITTSDPLRQRRSHVAVVMAVEQRLRSDGRLTPRYRSALAQAYLDSARKLYRYDRTQWRALVARAELLDPGHSTRQSRQYRVTRRLLGRGGAERVAQVKGRLRSTAAGVDARGSVGALTVEASASDLPRLRGAALRLLAPHPEGTAWRTGATEPTGRDPAIERAVAPYRTPVAFEGPPGSDVG